jgi:hypothetical protein
MNEQTGIVGNQEESIRLEVTEVVRNTAVYIRPCYSVRKMLNYLEYFAW